MVGQGLMGDMLMQDLLRDSMRGMQMKPPGDVTIPKSFLSEDADWTFNGEKFDKALSSLSSLVTNEKGEVTEKKRGLMNSFDGGSILYEPAKFMLGPLLADRLQPLAERYNLLDLSSGVTNYTDFYKRITKTTEDTLSQILWMITLRSMLNQVSGSGAQQAVPQQTKATEAPEAAPQEKTTKKDDVNLLREEIKKLKKDYQDLALAAQYGYTPYLQARMPYMGLGSNTMDPRYLQSLINEYQRRPQNKKTPLDQELEESINEYQKNWNKVRNLFERKYALDEENPYSIKKDGGIPTSIIPETFKYT